MIEKLTTKVSINTQGEAIRFANECYEVAEEFAIGFAEYCSYYRDKNRNYKLDMLHAKSKYDESYTTKELLEIYKKTL